ncbi:MAG TPA: hypothetical protein PK495_04840 [Bacteroidales bacterium]|nr:hypothetical protein [Bacteroidales bacterium]
MIFNTKQEKAKKFNYTPRFYDKKKEDVRYEKMKRGEDPNVEFRDYLRINLQEKRKMRQKSTRRVFIWLGLLIILLYIMLS